METKERLQELIDEDLSQTQLAEVCGCDRSTIKRWLKKYGLKTKNSHVYSVSYGPIERPDLEKMVNDGLTVDEIAEQTDRSHSSAMHWLKKYGLQTKGTRGLGTLLAHKCSCGETDPDNFYGAQKTTCKTCRNRFDSERLRAYKKQAVEEMGGQCELCGYNKCLAALDFHHQDPLQKDPDFVRFNKRSYAHKKEELEKCMLVCANCHREIHHLSPSS